MRGDGPVRLGRGSVSGDGAVQPRLGERIRALRKAKGYTLTQLATLAGVSPSFLSMLETGKTHVAASRLQGIAQVFGLTASDLLPDSDSHALIQMVREGQRPTLKGFGPGVLVQMLARDLHRRIQPVILSLQPGAVHSNETGHVGEEFLFVLAGRILLIVDGDQEMELESGDSAYYPSSLSHSYRNPGQEPAELMTISTPPRPV